MQRQKAIKAGDKESEIIREIDEQGDLITVNFLIFGIKFYKKYNISSSLG